jgi:outer membrane protein OmpA-like peptidoglycan-associated protein
MNTTVNRFTLLFAIGIVAISLVLPALAQTPAPNAASSAQATVAKPTGEKTKIEGVIVKRETDAITIRDSRGTETAVSITNNTQVKEKKENFFRKSKTYAMAQLQRGLYVEVEGRRTGAGNFQAERIRFKEDYMKMAASVENLVVPVEARVTATETRLSESEKNAQRLSGQIQEVSAISDAARGAAKTAQDSADQANVSIKQTAEIARNGIRTTNERISSLDEYEVKGSAVVNFDIGSSTLSADAKAELDKVAEEAGRQKGFVIEIMGFSSSDGDAAFNKRLSQKRADTVVEYLAENHSVPLRRIVMPLGLGEAKPLADNATREGRKQNRRVEVKVLVSKGLSQTGE